MHQQLKPINDMKWSESPVVNFYTNYEDLTEENIDVNKVCMFHIKVNLLKETEEEVKEMQMATRELIQMGIINPKDTPTFYQDKHSNHIQTHQMNNVVKTPLHRIQLQMNEKQPQKTVLQKNVQQNQRTLLDEIIRQRNMRR